MNRLYTLFVAALFAATTAVAQTVTFTFKTDKDITYNETGISGGATSSVDSPCKVTKAGVVLSSTNGYCASTKTFNSYANSLFTVTAPSGKLITAIEFSYNGKVYPFDEADGDNQEIPRDDNGKFSDAGAHVVPYIPESEGPSVVMTNSNKGKVELLSIVVSLKNDPNAIHVHNYSEAWSTDASGHWHVCTADGDCDTPKSADEAHSFADAPSGTQYYTCSVCSYVDATRKAAYDDMLVAEDVVTAIYNIGTVEYTSACKSSIDAARSAYNALSASQKSHVNSDAYKTLTDAEVYYEALAQQAAQDAADQSAASAVTSLISQIANVEYTADCKSRIDAARSAYNALTDAQKALVSNYQTLVDAEASYLALKQQADQTSADQTAASSVDALIDAIGTVQYTDACKAKIDAARSAFDALTDSQKTLVANAKALAEAEEAYQTLKLQAEQDTADQSAASAVSALINEIGIVEFTDACKTKISSARSAYDALTGAQKILVSNYQALVDAEDAYAALTPTSIAKPAKNSVKSSRFYHNGQLYIRHGDKVYDLTGRQVEL